MTNTKPLQFHSLFEDLAICHRSGVVIDESKPELKVGAVMRTQFWRETKAKQSSSIPHLALVRPISKHSR